MNSSGPNTGRNAHAGITNRTPIDMASDGAGNMAGSREFNFNDRRISRTLPTGDGIGVAITYGEEARCYQIWLRGVFLLGTGFGFVSKVFANDRDRNGPTPDRRVMNVSSLSQGSGLINLGLLVCFAIQTQEMG